jgi:hypothetical protein
MRRILLRTSAAVVAAGIVALPLAIEPDGSFASTTAWAKKDGGNGGGGNGGGSGNGGGAGNGGGSGGGSSAAGGGAGAGGKATGAATAAAGQTSTDTKAATAAGANRPAIAQAEQQLKAAQDELAAAARTLAETVGEGDATKIAVARGRVAGAQYAVSSAEMDLAVAEAGISDIEPAADSD